VSVWGRICIEQTESPFYNGFAIRGLTVDEPDYCPTSSEVYSARACSMDYQFTIAVR